ncbi:vacuolar cation/proton exchanger 2-like [Senna tora]|uniref:Vacuolar cation/proton exchanger n=1 Tax=Senna tora TaxID=362788 RepID=A0A834XH61_9FABA|nr:vacuolar cation/proton exchanger 2-like [Senna tora]
MLLVPGCAFFLGGIVHSKRLQEAAGVNSRLILISLMGILFPTMLHYTHSELHSKMSELYLSRFISFIMLVAYAIYLPFQLNSQQQNLHTFKRGPSESLNIPETFVAVVLFPIVEHTSAIMSAINDKLDVALEDTIGSAVRLVMFVMPWSVLVGWCMGKEMDLNFQLIEIAALVIPVIIVAFLLQTLKLPLLHLVVSSNLCTGLMGPLEDKIDLDSDEEVSFRSSPSAAKVHNFDFEATHVLAPGWVFFFSLLGITPLAERLGYATEQLALYTGPTVGGLLNATFGNATEMIISIYALKNGMIRVVQQSLLGSILSNMLLVLGCAFFTGGIVHKKVQVFNKASAVVNSGLLLMAVMGILFPAVLHFTHSEVHFGKSELSLSRFSSCIMLVAYASYLFFQLRSQNNLYSPIEEEGDSCENNDEEEVELTQWEAIGWLSVLTIWVSILSGYLVDAIQGASESLNMPVAFISVILLPIVGNAAEHASAIMFAVKDKLDITLGVAIGSSTQISMFVIPFCVVVGWCMGKEMDLNFQLFETATLFITVLVVAFLLQEGTSNYFKGLMLILCYLIVAASFFVHVDPKDDDD